MVPRFNMLLLSMVLQFMTASALMGRPIASKTTMIRSTRYFNHLVNVPQTALFAKKADRKESKGFGKKTEVSEMVDEESSSSSSSSSGSSNSDENEAGNSAAGASAGTGTMTMAKENNADAIFKKYGIKDGDGQKKAVTKTTEEKTDDAPFGQGVLDKIPAALQAKIDSILVTAVSLALGFVLLSGVGMSAGALTVVFPSIEIPEAADALITNFLTPAFTPALVFFLLCSSTFGLFKFAQISSSQTVYKE